MGKSRAERALSPGGAPIGHEKTGFWPLYSEMAGWILEIVVVLVLYGLPVPVLTSTSKIDLVVSGLEHGLSEM